MVGEILFAALAIFASSVGGVQPRDAHACSDGIKLGVFTRSLDNPDHLVAGRNGKFARRELAFDHMQIGTADPASIHANQHLPGTRLRLRKLGELERVGFDGRRSAKNAGFHMGQAGGLSLVVGWWEVGGGKNKHPMARAFPTIRRLPPTTLNKPEACST